MSYPLQCQRTYVNPDGNVAASGYYRSSLNQEIFNMLPPWMHMRQNQQSVGQQYLSPTITSMKRLEEEVNTEVRNKYITTARLDEPDILYRVRIPSNLDLTDASASGVRCIAAPSGYSASGIEQIWVKEIRGLEEFYYDVLPTRLEVTASDTFQSTVDSVSWHVTPSGIYDQDEKYVDIWKKKHDISWCYSNPSFRKQDVETMEDYETYIANGTGTPVDMDFYRGVLYWVGHAAGPRYYINMSSTKTQMPVKANLDLLATFDITDKVTLEPSGILVDQDGILHICDTNKTTVFDIEPRYDYFVLDKVNGYIYFREDYTYSGVFVSNT